MTYSKSFPRVNGKFPVWEEVCLSEEEEFEEELKAKAENTKLMKECIQESKDLLVNNGLKDYQSDMVRVATALFEKISSHQVYWKERRAKEKFDRMIKQN